MERELSSQQLQEYLQQVLELEKQSQTVTQTYNNYCAKLKSLAVPRYNAPIKPSDRNGVSTASATRDGLLHGLIGLLICLAVGFGVAALLDSCQTNDGFAVGFVGGFLSIIFSPLLRWAGVIIGIIWLGLSIKNAREAAELVNKKIRSNQVDYEIRLDAFQKDQARVNREIALLPGLRKDTAMLDERRKKTRELLDQFYSLDIIRPKYRSMVCVATFLEYLENERCYSLTGPDGCYNKFEDELRQGIIINQLTNISNQLTQIRQNQELLADALDEIQRNTNSLCSGLQQVDTKLNSIQQDTQITAWYTRQAEEEQRAMYGYVLMRDWVRNQSQK